MESTCDSRNVERFVVGFRTVIERSPYCLQYHKDRRMQNRYLYVFESWLRY